MNIDGVDYRGMVFLHPMKTAGTSVGAFFRKFIQQRHGEVEIVHMRRHQVPQEFMWKMGYDDNWFDDMYCLIFVRNPYERLVSFYHHMRQIGGHAEGLCKQKTFHEFILDKDLKSIVTPISTYSYYKKININNYVVRYENLDGCVYELIELLDLGEHAKEVWDNSERLMATDHLTYETYYTSETKAIAFNTFKEDFITYGYEE